MNSLTLANLIAIGPKQWKAALIEHKGSYSLWHTVTIHMSGLESVMGEWETWLVSFLTHNITPSYKHPVTQATIQMHILTIVWLYLVP